MNSYSWDETTMLKAEEIVLRSTLAQRPSRPPALPTSPPPSSAALPALDDHDEGHASTSSSTPSETEEDPGSDQSITFFRKSSSPSREGGRLAPTKKDHFRELPWHVLGKILLTLEIHERAKAAEVCKRWYNLLTGGLCPLENVVVLNVFQQKVWQDTVGKNTGSAVRTIKLPNLEALYGILLHASSPGSVKIWYNNPAFAKQVLEKLEQTEVRTKCVDIFPYTSRVGIEHFFEHMPNLTGITMRPHGTAHFWDGLDIEHFPNFPKLDTLIMDSFNLKENVELPESVTTFEWYNRCEASFPQLLPKLKRLKKLEYLYIGHANLLESWQDFFDVVSFDNMPNLNYLMFRFCRFFKEVAEDGRVPDIRLYCLPKVQFLKFDLCYGYLPRIIETVLAMTTENLKIMSVNIISDETTAVFSQLFDFVSRKLKDRKISLHLGLLQKSDLKVFNKKIAEHGEPQYGAPSHAFMHILWKFESSFCDDNKLMNVMFLSNYYPYLMELKFIQCSALTNEILEAIAAGCARLKKLSILCCENTDNFGILPFIATFKERMSKNLEVIWKRDSRRFARLAAFYLQLTSENNRELMEGYTARFYSKSLSEHTSGESIVIKEKTSGKTLVIQDYDYHDNHRILGVVLPFDGDEKDDGEVPAYTPPLPPEAVTHGTDAGDEPGDAADTPAGADRPSSDQEQDSDGFEIVNIISSMALDDSDAGKSSD